MSEQTQNERMQEARKELQRCIEHCSKVWTKEAYEEWYKTFRCE